MTRTFLPAPIGVQAAYVRRDLVEAGAKNPSNTEPVLVLDVVGYFLDRDEDNDVSVTAAVVIPNNGVVAPATLAYGAGRQFLGLRSGGFSADILRAMIAGRRLEELDRLCIQTGTVTGDQITDGDRDVVAREYRPDWRTLPF